MISNYTDASVTKARSRGAEAVGRKVGYSEALIRNIMKHFIPAIMVDAVLLLLSVKDRQRRFDRIAGTIVIEHS